MSEVVGQVGNLPGQITNLPHAITLLSPNQRRYTRCTHAASDQQHPTNQMEPQRRQESVGQIERPEAKALGSVGANRRHGQRSVGWACQPVRNALLNAHKHALAPLALVRVVPLRAVGIRRCAGVMCMIARAAIPQCHRTGLGTGLRSDVHGASSSQALCAVLAAQPSVGRGSRACAYYIRSPGRGQRRCRLSANRFPSIATIAERSSRIASM